MPSGSLETLSSVCVNGIPPWTVGNGWAGGMKLLFFDQRQQTKLKSEILFTFKNVFLVKSTQRRHFNGRASASVPEMMVGPYKQSGIYRVRTKRRRLVPWHIHNYTYNCMKEHINYIIYLMFKLSGGISHNIMIICKWRWISLIFKSTADNTRRLRTIKCHRQWQVFVFWAVWGPGRSNRYHFGYVSS